MEKFKIAMGFPMLATAVWLFHLLPTFYGKRVLWMGMFLVLLALAGWMFGEFVQRGRAQRGVAGVLAGFVLIGGFAYAIEGKLAWREPLDANGAPGMVARNPAGVAWKPWSREAVAQAREQGRPVLVDFTAEWCLTCNLNVKPVLESAPVRKKLAEIGAVAFLADYTRTPPVMTEELRRYHRAGVPLVLVYPADRSRPAMVLPEAITTGIVLEALNKAVP
jgi:thiol:disulfide interchange protein DsbD